MIKVYKAHSNLSAPIVMGGKVICYAEFTDEKNTYRTSNEVHQTALEALPCFGKLFWLSQTIGEAKKIVAPIITPEKEVATPIVTPANTPTAPVDENPATDAGKKSYPDITDWQDAKEALRKEYGVAHQSLGTPQGILKKASEVGVDFPNLKLEGIV